VRNNKEVRKRLTESNGTPKTKFLNSLTPVAGSTWNLLAEKVSWFYELSQNLNSERLFQSKTRNLMRWTKLISADFSSNSPHFTALQPRGLFLTCFFFEKSLSNIWGIYDSAPQTLLEKDHQNSNSEESSENREIFSASKFDRATGMNSLRIRILRNFFKVKPVISWNGQNSFQQNIPSNSRHFTRINKETTTTTTTLLPQEFFLVRFFFEKSRSNIWGIYGSTPQPQEMNTGVK